MRNDKSYVKRLMSRSAMVGIVVMGAVNLEQVPLVSTHPFRVALRRWRDRKLKDQVFAVASTSAIPLAIFDLVPRLVRARFVKLRSGDGCCSPCFLREMNSGDHLRSR